MTLQLKPVEVPVSKEDRQRMIEPPQINGSSGSNYTTWVDSNIPGARWWTRLKCDDAQAFCEKVTYEWLSGFWYLGDLYKKDGKKRRNVLEEGHVIILACGPIGVVPVCVAFQVVKK